MKVPERGQGGGDFVPCPAGTQNAVCVDVVTIKDVERNYGGKSWKEDQFKFVFQVEKTMDNGKRFVISTFGMKASLHEKATLRKFLEAWNGSPFKVGDDVDPESFYARPCFLTVVHKKGGQDGTLTYANISGIAPIMEVDGVPVRAPIKPDANYVRVKDRPDDSAHDSDHEDTSDVPF